MPQKFPSLDVCIRTLKVQLPTPRETWRLVADPLVGHITALPMIHGSTVATNGIMVLLYEEPTGKSQFGHLQWFIPDPSEGNNDLSDLWNDSTPAKTNGKAAGKKKVLPEYIY